MGKTQLALTTLFADIEGSTRLYDQIGDQRAHAIMAICVERISGCVTRFGGRVIKTIGDEVMATFPTAADAAKASCEMQIAMGDPVADASTGAAFEIRIHIGFHHGPVIEEASDVFGDSVNVAARLVGLAKSDQILTSQETADVLGKGEGTPTTRRIDPRRVKGKRAELEVCEVIWRKLGLTAIIKVPTDASPAAQGRLILTMPNKELEMGLEASAGRSEVSIGRAFDADLVIDDSRASRSHAKIEVRQGNFILRDNSTNGTYVTPDAGRPVLVHRDEMVLTGSGSIGVSPDSAADGSVQILFRCEPG